MDAIRAVAEPTEADLERARAVVAAHLRPTPVVELELPDGHGTVLAKLECLQPTGSFKVRGALAALAALAAGGQGGARVVTASAGNHGLGVVLAARRLGVPAIVVVPVAATLADGLAGNLEPGSVTPALAAGRVHAFAAVSEAEIEAAIRFLAVGCGLVVEGAGAVGVAALLAGKVPVAGQVAVVLTGRNIAAAALARILQAPP